MALQRVPNLYVTTPDPSWPAGTAGTLDAAGESVAIIGYVALENGNAATKTISSAGGKLCFRVGNPITFGNAGTSIDFGIQDVSATTGLEDATFDVKGTFVGGTDTITANTYLQVAMETGTKTLTHGQLIAVVIEMTARVTDSVLFRRLGPPLTGTTAIPYGTNDIGSGPVKTNQVPIVHIEFDDGTTGWIMGVSSVAAEGRTTTTFNSGSATDEYAAVFTPAFTCEIDGIGLDLSDIDATDDFEIRLYSDPLGTPSVLQTLTPDPDQTNVLANVGAIGTLWSCPPTTLTAGVTYGVAARPTTVNGIAIGYIDLGSGHEKIKTMSVLGATLKLAGRADVTGAFTEVQTYYWPYLSLRISKLDDGAGSGGGLIRHPGMAGGLNA